MNPSMYSSIKPNSGKQGEITGPIRSLYSNPADGNRNEYLKKELSEKYKKILSQLEKTIITLKSYKSKKFTLTLPEGANPKELFDSIIQNIRFEIILPKNNDFNAVSNSHSIRFYEYPNGRPNANIRVGNLNLFSAIAKQETKLFLVGGISQTGKVSKLIISYDTMQQATEKYEVLRVARSSCAAVIWKSRYLYAIGGIGEQRALSDSIEKFDIKNFKLAPQVIGMKHKRNKVSAVILHDILYIASPDTTYIERFDLKNTRSITEIVKLERMGLTPRLITQFKDQIILFADENRSKVVMILKEIFDAGDRKGREQASAYVEFNANWSQQGASKYDQGVFCVDYETCNYQYLDISRLLID